MSSWSNSDVPAPSALVPEKRLLAAVLQRAITDFLTGDGDLKESARVWLIEEEDDGDSPISFLFICEALDLDAEGLKRAILSQASQGGTGSLVATPSLATAPSVVAAMM